MEYLSKDEIPALLREAELRPTRQRMALAGLLFCGPHRHVTAEELHREAADHGHSISLATVYNTLNQFSEVGLLREVVADGSRTFYDTNLSDHHHFYAAKDGKLMDIPAGELRIEGMPTPPKGMKVSGIDVIVRLEE